jgi:transposase
VRATTAFNKIVTPLGAKVTNVAFEADAVVLLVRPTRRRLFCVCGFSTRAIYDRSVRRWRHLDALGTKVVIEAEIRRVACTACEKVVTEEVTWARHGARHTSSFENVVAWWCQRADRTSVASFWRCDWTTVTAIVVRVVAEHLRDSRFDGLTRIGVDEIAWSKGHRYVTVVVDQSRGDVIWVGDGKDANVLEEFYALLGEQRCAELTAVSMDMGRAYSAATRAKTKATICWDPFHVVKLLNKAVTDTIRWSNLTRQGLPLTKREATDLRWAMLKKASDLTPEQSAVLDRHRKARHACWRAQQLKEDFRGLYLLEDPANGPAYLDRWLARACRCRIAPMLKAVKMVRENRTGILAAVELGLSNSRLEGTNSKIRIINHRGYGHHSVKALTAMIYLCCSGIDIELPW